MEKTSINRWFWLILILLVAGCAPKKPADTSDPAASMAWLDYALEKSEEKPTAPRQLRSIYTHAAKLEAAHGQDASVSSFIGQNKSRLARIPEKVFRLSIPAKDFESFEWALAEDPNITTRFDELIQTWERGAKWRELALEAFPDALPVFMGQALDAGNAAFFDHYAADFKASGYKLKSPMQRSEFLRRYQAMIGTEAAKAIAKKDNARIAFLVEHTPTFKTGSMTSPTTHKQLQALGNYVLYEAGDEQLTARLFQLGFEFDNLDLEQLDMKSSLVKSLKADPENAVRMVGLDQADVPLTKNAARFLLQFPVEKLTNLHPQHVDEAIKMCMQAGGTDTAKKFIQLKAAQKPLEKADYIQLMTLGLKYNDNQIYGFAKLKGGSINITELDIGELAYNQRIFERNAPKFFGKIYDSMEDVPQADGITLGTIYRIFESENEKAGLWVVRKYDLEDDWLAATGDETLLMAVCRAGNLEAARYLIERRKMDLEATTRYSGNETTVFGQARAKEGKLGAIHFAAQGGNPELIKYLKSKGANINARSNFGATPLMLAASAGQLDAVKTLIALGASVNMQMNASNRDDIMEDGKGYNQLSTALNRARAYGHPEIAAALEEAGAK